MSIREITAIVLRLFSIWLLVQVILNVPGMALLWISVEQYQGQVIPKYVYPLFMGIFIATGLLVACLVWVSAKSALARCPSAEAGSLEQDGQTFLLQIGGTYFIVTALANLPRSLGFLVHSLELSYTNFLWPFGLLFQLCIGLALLVKAPYWTMLLAKLRGRS